MGLKHIIAAIWHGGKITYLDNNGIALHDIGAVGTSRMHIVTISNGFLVMNTDEYNNPNRDTGVYCKDAAEVSQHVLKTLTLERMKK